MKQKIICPKCKGNGYIQTKEMIDRLKLVKQSIKQCDDCQSEGELIVGEKYEKSTLGCVAS